MARVLLVDDDAGQLELRKLVLEHHGHTILTAESPAAAEQILGTDSLEFIVMDLRLPEAADGLGLIRRFYSMAAFSGRILVLSGYPKDIEGTPEAAMVEAILAKPFRSEALVALLS